MSIAVVEIFICPKNVVVVQTKRVDVDRFRCVKWFRSPRIEALLFRIFCKWVFRPALKMVNVAPESTASRPVAYDSVFS